MKIRNILKTYRNSRIDIDINELKEIINENEEAILLDVRSPLEFKEGHLKNAINIPLYDLESCCNYKIKDKYKIIIVYCQSGIRSKKGVKILYKNGYKNLYHLKGGLDNIN